MHVHLHLGGVANDVWPRAIKEAEGAEGVGLSDLLRLLLGLLVLLRMALEYGRLCTVKGYHISHVGWRERDSLLLGGDTRV